MERIKINTDNSVSEILVGADWKSVRELLPSTDFVIITDNNVNRIYGTHFPDCQVFQIKAGESSKTLETVEFLGERMIDSGIDRTGFILGIGGGVVCDIAGFLASIYMRGIRFGYVSTSLLSQVDASTGGKNGVNLGSIKNVIGCFRQPEFVICDPAMLGTLPEEEYYSGLAELIKTGIIGDLELFESIESGRDAIVKRDPVVMSGLIAKAVKFKADVVTQDEKESGLRRILNFGHTYGHAIEMYKSFRHGYAVASGMELAAKFSMIKGFLSQPDYMRIIELLKSFRLLRRHDIPDEHITNLIMHDKKKSGNEIYFVFIEKIGRAFAEKIPVTEAVDFYRQNKPGN